MPSLAEIVRLDKEREIKEATKTVTIPRMRLSEALFIAICSVEPYFSEKYTEVERFRAVEELKRLYEFMVGQHDFSVVL